MADLVITASSVVPASGNTGYQQAIAGETVAAGDVVYKDSSTGKYFLAQCDGTAEEAGSEGVAIALNAASANQPLAILSTGDLTLNAVLTAGGLYVLSNADGKIMPIADFITSTWKLTLIGYAKTTTTLALMTTNPGATGVALA